MDHLSGCDVVSVSNAAYMNEQKQVMVWVKRDRAGSITSWSGEDTFIVTADLDTPGYLGTVTPN